MLFLTKLISSFAFACYPSTKEVYDKMESDMNSVIDEKKKEYSIKQINIESNIKIGPIVETIVKFTKEKDI